MSAAFHMGGWGMYPTLISGLVLLGGAFAFAIAPDARRRAVVRALATLTMLVATLGFVSGVIKSCTACDYEPSYVVHGVGESLANIGFGLVLLVIAGIGVAIGTARRAAVDDQLHSA
ncbi:MAG TPA: hypothetical protein VH143_01950 [Kofleriaceae bacterium]|nr:hypothetical protein [Kofleriaceae bacterium]